MVERHNKPEVEVKASREVLLNPVTISRSDKERVFIESSINSVRVSIAIKQVSNRYVAWNAVFMCIQQLDDVDKILCHKFMRFMMLRAEHFFILRRKPVQVSLFIE